MKIRRPVLTLALASLLSNGIASAAIPFCGGNKISLGDRFSLTMYMIDRSSSFDLEYAVPDADVRTLGAVVATKPIKLTFAGLDATPAGNPRMGYANLDLREPEGQRFETAEMHFDCGNSASLSAKFSGTYPPNQPPAPDSFDSPFFLDRAKIPACINALMESGRFALTFYRAGQIAPSLTLQGRLPLYAAIHKAEGLYRRYLKQADVGECRIIPAPPLPF
jgi:hypothetical protein